ncbi:MAG: TetR/AcrR family transcriptional regulator [Solirubrobacterales bacterium]
MTDARHQAAIEASGQISTRRVEIADAAIAIADAEGFEAVSLRKIAERLGVGTMTLYSYIENKDDLIAVMGDVITAEYLVPEPMPEGWRARARAITTRTYETFVRHPWLATTITGAPVIKPNTIRHIDQSVRAIFELDIELDLRGTILTMLDDYAIGHALNNIKRKEMFDPSPSSARAAISARLNDATRTEIERMFRDGEVPTLVKLFDDVDTMLERISGGPPQSDNAFEIGLDTLLDGIQVMINRHASS